MQCGPEAILAIDLGTSSLKTVLLSRHGIVLAEARAPFPTLHPAPDQDEQRFQDWLSALGIAVLTTVLHAGNHQVVAIALTGQMHGTVCLDPLFRPMRDAIIWSDRRTADVLPSFVEIAGPVRLGGALATGYLGATVAWLRDHEPDTWLETAKFALPVDALAAFFTGTLATDPSNAVGTGLYAIRNGAWDAAMLSSLGLTAARLSSIIATGSSAGPLRSEAAAELGLPAGIPVFLAGGDAATAAVSIGATTGDTIALTISTGAQVIRTRREPIADAEGRWLTWPAAIPTDSAASPWLQVGTLLNAGRAIDWAARVFAPGGERSGAPLPLFLPHLAGERTPELDASAAGMFIGLRETHTAADLRAAVREGVALAITDVFDRVSESDRPDRVVLGGGGAQDSELVQYLANAIGMPITVPSSAASSAHGAALIAGHSLGWWRVEDLDPPSGMIVCPDPGAHRNCLDRLSQFRHAVSTSVAMNRRLASNRT